MAKEFAENTTETSATLNVCGQKGQVEHKTSTNYDAHYDYLKQVDDNKTRVELKKLDAEIAKTHAAVEMRRIEKAEKIETRQIEMEEKVRVAAEIYKQNQMKLEAEKINATREAQIRRIEMGEKVRVANEVEFIKLYARQVEMRKIEEEKTKELAKIQLHHSVKKLL